MTKSDCFKILNLNKNASIDDIKKAYRALVKKYHPDIAGRNDYYVEQFRKITKAYKILTSQTTTTSCEKSEKDIKDIIKNIKNKIDNYINLFKRKRRKEPSNFSGIFLKEVDYRLINIGEDELILRLAGSNNFYVMVEAIKALYKINTYKSYCAIVENYYKYSKDLRIFVSFLLKKRLNLLDDFLKENIKSESYYTIISILSFLYFTYGNVPEKKYIDYFTKENLNVSKIELSKYFVKYKKILSNNELKIGEKLLLMDRLEKDELIIALSIKSKFPKIKIGRIISDLGFLSYKEIEEVLKTKTIFND